MKHLKRSTRWWAAVFCVLALVASACGGGESAETSDADAGDTAADADAGDTTADEADAPAEGDGGDGEPVTLTFSWFEWPPAQLFEDFANENYPKENVTIAVQTVPVGQWHDAIFTQFAAQDTDFDIPVLDSQWMGETVEGGHVLEITDFAKENIDLEAYPPNLLGAYGQFPLPPDGNFNPDGPVYGLPLLADTWVLIYRKDLIGEEPPGSWDEMLEAARQCQAENEGMSGLAFHGANDYDVAAVTLNTVIWVNGGDIWNPETEQIEGVLDDQVGMEAIDQLVNDMVPLAPDGVGTAFIGEVNAAMSQGEACMGMNWVAGLEGIQNPENSTLGDTEEEVLDKLGFAPLPPGDTPIKPLGGQGMSISAYSDNQDEALEFLEWFAEPETQTAWAEAGGVPTTTGALESDAFLESRPWNSALTESVPNLKDFWTIPEYARMLEVHTSNANAAITGVKPPEQALQDIAEEEQQILEEGGGL